ncbi:MAG: WD40 repeat domain-containing protein [Bacteroidetes bacterium]|nr:WD40 repeat domain-containing protein [Bacteroidota bacterium]
MLSISKIAHLTGHAGAVYTLAKGIAPNSVLSGSGDKMLAQWDLTSVVADKFAVKMPAIVYSALVIQEKNLLLIGTAAGSLHVVDLSNKTEIKYLTLNYGGIFTIVHVKSSNSILLSTVNGFLIQLDASSFDLKRELHVSKLKLRSIQTDEINDRLYVCDGTGELHVFQLSTLTLIKSFQSHTQSCNVVKLHPNGKYILTGGKDAHLNMFDINTFELVKSIPAHNFAIYDICFLEGTNYFATASRDKTIKLWDAESVEFLVRINKETHQSHTHSVNTLYWDKECKRLVSAGDDRAIMIWEIK